MKICVIIVVTVAALLILSSRLLADDGSITLDEQSRQDSTNASPAFIPRMGIDYSLEKPNFRHSPRRSVILSAILPGLGQADNGRWAKATSFVVIGSLLVAKIAVESQRADRYLYLSRHAASDEEAEALYGAYTDHFDRRDRFIWWAVGFWIYNMLDAYVDGHLFGFSRQ